MPLALLLFALLLAACGDEGGAALSGDLRYVRSGGIAGDVDELLVRPDGRATLKSRRGGDREFRLPARELEALAAEAGAMETIERASTPATPDALVHAVSYDGRTAATDDPNLSRSELAPLVGRLERILGAHR